MVPLNFVLTTLPVYALSFFKALSGIISSIESFLNNFFFFGAGGVGGSEDKRKIYWIGWNSVFEEGVSRVGC